MFSSSYRAPSSDNFPIIMGVILFIVLILGLIFLPMAYLDNGVALRAAETSGYTDARVLDSHYFFSSMYGCSKGDDAAFDVAAKNPQGKPVQIVVCAGWPFKGATVRVK
jgi:hypothetical protein